jgi:hypothetical protein
MSANDTNAGFNLPEGREVFRLWEVAAILAHSKHQVVKLIEEGKFGKVTDCGRGKKSSIVIPRAGLIKFLQENSK